jgi:hypothetical protein
MSNMGISLCEVIMCYFFIHKSKKTL